MDKVRKKNFIFLIGVFIFIGQTAFASSTKIMEISYAPSIDLSSEMFGIGDTITFTMAVNEVDTQDTPTGPATGGTASLSIGTVVKGITLFDDGLSAHGDTTPNDGIYSCIFTVAGGDDAGSFINSAPIYGYFKDAQRKEAKNNAKEFNKIIIDGTRPFITNYGISPNPFDPTPTKFERAKIKYTLTENATVAIDIYHDQNVPATPFDPNDDTLIRSLTPLPAYFGDNSAEWDGYDSSGKMMTDDNYTYRLNAVDGAGNEAVEVIGSVIISTIRLEISELSITPNPFTPDGNGVNDWTTIRLKIRLEATPDQLELLGFYVDNPFPSAWDVRPYALVGIKGYDASGEKLELLNWPDFSSGVETDPFPNPGPNYDPSYVDIAKFLVESVTGSETETWLLCGDGDKENDFDALIALNALNGDTSTGVFYQEFSVSTPRDWVPPNGTYIFRVQIELVSAAWVFDANAAKDQGCAAFHYKPVYHYGTASNILDGRVEAIESPVTPPDNIAPVVIATDPGDESIKAPGEVSKFISAILDDGPKGSGIHFSRSTISLLGPEGIPVAGHQANDGVQTLYWMLDEPLIEGGEYTILVKPVDNTNNGSEAKPQEFKFKVKDTIAPSVVEWFPPSGSTVNPGFTSDIWAVLTDEGGSGLDINSCQISLFKDTAAIAGGISNDKANKLIFRPTSPLIESGTYTIKVTATDNEGNIALEESTFTILSGIEVALGDKVYLTLPATTKTIDPDTFVVEGAITIDTPVSAPEPPEGMDIIGSNISFIPSNLGFDKDVILKMHYTDNELSLKGTTSSELKIYEYDGSSWKVVEGGALYEDDKYLLLNIKAGSALVNNYALLFTLPQVVNVSFEGEVYLSLSAGTKRTDVSPATLVKSGMITVPDTPVTAPEPPEGMDMIGSIISFGANPPIKTTLKFDTDIVLTMHYTDEELSFKETTANKLKIYKYNGSSWVVADGGGRLNEANKELTLTIPANSALASKYAILFSKDVAQSIVFSDETVFAYPNPVRGDGPVTFQYDLENDARITIKVFTLTGTLVFSDKFDAFSGEARRSDWDLNNNKGKSLATGLYIYSIEMDDGSTNKSVIKKLAVIR